MRKQNSIKKAAVVTAVTLFVAVIGAGCSNGTGTITSTEATTTPEVTQETETVEEAVTTTEEETTSTKEASLTSNVYEYLIMNDGKEYMNYIHFYENGVWYYSKYNNSSCQAGYYTVEETTFELPSLGNDYTKNDEEMVTCNYKIILYDLNGETVVGECGYNDISTIIGLPLQNGHDFVQNPESTHTSDDETGVSMASYYLEGDEYSTVDFKHNGTFQDTINMMISGVWEKEDTVFTMTNKATGKSYTLTDNGDGTAVYIAEDGTEITLVAPVEKIVKMEFTGTTAGAYGDLEGVIACYDDGSLLLNISYAGSAKEYEGTWEMAADYSKISLVIDGTDYEAPRAEDNSFSFDYTTTDGTGDVVIPFIKAASN